MAKRAFATCVVTMLKRACSRQALSWLIQLASWLLSLFLSFFFLLNYVFLFFQLMSPMYQAVAGQRTERCCSSDIVLEPSEEEGKNLELTTRSLMVLTCCNGGYVLYPFASNSH